MVDFIGWQRVTELARAEPVIFVEIMGEAPGERSKCIRRGEDRWPPPWA